VARQGGPVGHPRVPDIEIRRVTDPAAADPAFPTILLVEDEPAIRSLMRRMLEGAGYALLVARNGDEAMTMARHHSGVIDLLLTDVVMPRMNGFELGALITGAHPETNVLFVSGYSRESSAVRDGLRSAGKAFLLKPFTQDALLGKVREVLQS
jgi:two-component system cell cycle sensor histidine kinase/response regulator CckA